MIATRIEENAASPRADKLLLASIEDLPLSEGFRAYMQRLADMRDRDVKALGALADPTEIYRAQGRVNALTLALEIHRILLIEVKEKIRSQKL